MIDNRWLKFTNQYGVEIPLGLDRPLNFRHAKGNGIVVIGEITGLGLAAKSITTQSTPNIDGATLSAVFKPPRNITIPLAILGRNDDDYQARLKELRELVADRFWLQVETNNSVRRIELTYRSGLEDANEIGAQSEHVLDCVALTPNAQNITPDMVVGKPFNATIPFLTGR